MVGVTDTSFGVLLQALHPHADVDVVDFADNLWSRLQCVEVRRLYKARSSLGGLKDSVSEYVTLLADHCAGHGYDLVIPVNDGAVELLKRARALHPLPVALPPDPVARFAHDKLLLLREAQAVGLRVPELRLVSSHAELESALDSVRLPLFFKPIHSAAIRNDRLLRFVVKRVQTPDQLENAGREVLPSVPVMLQEAYPGLGIGYTALAHEGRALVDVFHQRLHEPPEGGGGSSYRRTIPVPDAALLQGCRDLMERIHWSGVGMLEFRHDPARDAYYLMELNGRLWGSLNVHLVSGYDYPRFLLEYYLDGQRAFAFRPTVPVAARNIHRDAAWLLRRLTSGDTPLRSRLGLVRQWFKEWRHALSGREAIDFLRLRYLDVFFLHCTTPLVQFVCRAGDGLWRRAVEVSFHLAAARFRRRLSSLLVGKRTPKLLFVCFGNINRSPFARLYAKGVAPDAQWSSAGLYPMESRMASIAAERTGRAHGLDLRSHASRIVRASDLEDADAVFVFDAREYLHIARTWPHARPKLVPLGTFDSRETSAVVEDPDGRGDAVFARVFAKIAHSIDGAVSSLRQPREASMRQAAYVIRLDDCHPRMNRANFERVHRICSRHGVRPVIGVIPECRWSPLLRDEPDPRFWEQMRQLQGEGWTVALHGYTHEPLSNDSGLLHINRRSEFAGLAYEQQYQRLKDGLAGLRAQGLDTAVFMAPWHSLDAHTVKALKALGFDTITDGYGLVPRLEDGITWVPQQLQTPRPMPFGVWTFALHADVMVERDFRRLEAFVAQNAARIVSFEEARSCRVGAAGRVADLSFAMLLRTYRRRRSARQRVKSMRIVQEAG